MKTEKLKVVLLVSLLLVATVGLFAQQGGMAMPSGMQNQMPTPEEMQKIMEAQVKSMVDQTFPQVDDDEDGELSMDEFKKLYEMTAAQDPTVAEEETEEEKAERMKEEFEEIDADDDDSLTKEEIISSVLDRMNEDLGIEVSEEDEEDSEDEGENDDDEAAEDEMEEN